MKRYFLLFGFVLIGLFFYFDSIQRNRLKISLQKTNLIFSGIVTNVNEVCGYNGYGIITLIILNSNTKEYDPRDSMKYYYCIIKNNVAEVYDHAYSDMIGDMLNINTSQSIHTWGSKGNESKEGSISINPNDAYYEYIRRNTGFNR